MAHNQWNLWTPEQDQRLRTLFEAGCSAVLVAAKLKRSLSATKARCRTLKISVKRKKAALPVDGQITSPRPIVRLVYRKRCDNLRSD
jgi:hypothetical protein